MTLTFISPASQMLVAALSFAALSGALIYFGRGVTRMRRYGKLKKLYDALEKEYLDMRITQVRDFLGRAYVRDTGMYGGNRIEVFLCDSDGNERILKSLWYAKNDADGRDYMMIYAHELADKYNEEP